MKRKTLRLSLLFLTLTGVACASSPRSESWEITPAAEKRMAQEALPQIRRDYPVLRDAEIQEYVSNLGQRLVKENDFAGKPYDYTFVVVDAPMVNAFALPGGHIFVSSSLLQFVESEAELAGVISHEIGHVQERHAAIRIQSQRWAEHNGYNWILGGFSMMTGALAGYGASRSICGGVSVCTNQLVAVGMVSGTMLGLTAQKYIFLANSRENELVADRLGFAYAIKAGFAAEKVTEFYSRLQQQEKPKLGNDPLRDAEARHPPSQERIRLLRDLTAQTPIGADATLYSPEFLRMRERIFALKNASSSESTN